jgi:hypothetical protein
MREKVSEGARRLSLFFAIVASLVYGVWAGLALVVESQMFQRDVGWVLL